jgi:hypothetical protein
MVHKDRANIIQAAAVIKRDDKPKVLLEKVRLQDRTRDIANTPQRSCKPVQEDAEVTRKMDITKMFIISLNKNISSSKIMTTGETDSTHILQK